MKTQMKKLALGLLALNLFFAGQALAAPVELQSKDYILVTIPAESAEATRLVYGIGGNQVEAFPKDGEVIELNAVLHTEGGDFLGNFSFLGSVEDGNNTLEITGTDPVGYTMDIKFKSTSEKAAIDAQTPLVLESAGAKAQVIFGGSLDEIQDTPIEPIFFGEEAQDFHHQGVLDIRFVVEQPAVDDGGQNGGGQNDGGADLGQPEASSGCSMAPNAASSALNLLALLPMAGMALAFRRRK